LVTIVNDRRDSLMSFAAHAQ